MPNFEGSMNSIDRLDRELLLKTAKMIAVELSRRSQGTSLRIKIPQGISEVNTGGWRARIGSLGQNEPKLQIWLDYFARYKERKFNFCLYHDGRSKLRKLADSSPMKKPICRFVTEDDMEKDGFYLLGKPLQKKQFNNPVFEQYWGRYAYFGVYDPTVRLRGNAVNRKLCERGAAFFESVARTMPKSEPESEVTEIYPQEENRQRVVSHLQRERSRFLANECKNRDDYRCQVCGTRYEEVYGSNLGKGFAEAHHRVPLSRLKPGVKTRLKDLATVCANCHRMLHHMRGKYDDVEKLRRIFRRRNK